MDTEKFNEMQEKLAAGKPVTDEGPYYHHVEWESYKGWAKGKFGGAVIGTLIGTVVGGAAALVLLPTLGAAAAGVGALAFAGIGLYKGMDEFGKINTVSAAVAAGLDTAERRNQYNLDKVALEIKAELGNKEAAKELENLKDPAYRTTHYVPPQDESLEHGPVFWKVAMIGLAVGLAAGLLLATSGLSVGILEHIIGHTMVNQLGSSGITALSMATFGTFGASFGINRDIFRQIFDQTDMLYRGMPKKVGELVPAQMVTRGKDKEINEKQLVNQPFVYDSHIKYPESGTHHRDQVIKTAQQTLAQMDHTSMTPH